MIATRNDDEIERCFSARAELTRVVESALASPMKDISLSVFWWPQRKGAAAAAVVVAYRFDHPESRRRFVVSGRAQIVAVDGALLPNLVSTLSPIRADDARAFLDLVAFVGIGRPLMTAGVDELWHAPVVERDVLRFVYVTPDGHIRRAEIDLVGVTVRDSPLR